MAKTRQKSVGVSENKKSEALAPALTLFVVPSGLEPDRALRNYPVGNFSEGASLLRSILIQNHYISII